MSKPAYKILLLSAHEWSNLWRRKQRLAHELSKRPDVASVLYVNPPVMTSVLDVARGSFESGHLEDDVKAHWRALLGQPQRILDDVWGYTGSQKTLPLTKSETLRRWKPLLRLNEALYHNRLRVALNKLPGDELLIYTCYPLQSFALDAFQDRALLCYDWTDDWTSFELLPVPREEMAHHNDRLVREADLVLAVSSFLYQQAKAMNPNTAWMPNATAFNTLDGQVDETDLSGTLVDIPRPRLAYIGQIGDRVDFELLESVARRRADWSLVMIGPVWSNREQLAAQLDELPNVHFIGSKPYAGLPGLLKQADVCLIPHTVDDLTASMDPIKLYDYLATGKPIVTTPVAGVDRFADAIYIADTHTEFISKLETALDETDRTLIDKRRAYGRENSWSARTEQLWSLVNAVKLQKSEGR